MTQITMMVWSLTKGHIITHISHASKLMLKILQARLQQYVNSEIPNIQAGLRKGRRTRDQIANILWIIEKSREFQKNIDLYFVEYTKAVDYVDHNKLENSFSSVQFSSVLSPVWLFSNHEPQLARPSSPWPTPRVHPNPCPLSQWCHPTISSSAVTFSSCPQSFPALGSFQMSQLSASGGQIIDVSASTSVLPVNTQDWSPLGWTNWISLKFKGLSRVFSNTIVYCDPHSQRLGIVNKAEIDVFMELSCFFDDPVDVSNLISGSSAFSKTSLIIWKFTVHKKKKK